MSVNVEKIVDGIVDFVAYVESFYGDVPDAIYPMGATPKMILEATQQYISEGEIEFCGDSLDREKVRDIMIEKFGLVFPQGGIKLEAV